MSSSHSANAQTGAESSPAKQFYEVAMVSEIAPGSGKTVYPNGQQIALFNLDGTFYAIDDSCPHRGAPLSEGYLKGDQVLCAWHCFDFNLKTGACEGVPELHVATYEVKIEGETVYVLC
ncbi:MAG TPA: Rieske 2Fe-2S domain-containing protein [Blastocatellia bacterium]|nr:Rieske 2Fe-2S domain-containing protein [Blastocatellia bacterium]